MLNILDTMVAAIYFIFFRHGKLFRSYEVECRIEVAHCCDERVYGTSILQVAYKINVEVVEGALSLVYRVEVKETL